MRVAMEALHSSDVIRISLKPPGGYDGSIRITVGAPGEDEFDAEVNLSNWTRFPARIRAAATELRDRGFQGTFRISHNQGELRIERIPSSVAF